MKCFRCDKPFSKEDERRNNYAEKNDFTIFTNSSRTPDCLFGSIRLCVRCKEDLEEFLNPKQSPSESLPSPDHFTGVEIKDEPK